MELDVVEGIDHRGLEFQRPPVIEGDGLTRFTEGYPVAGMGAKQQPKIDVGRLTGKGGRFYVGDQPPQRPFLFTRQLRQLRCLAADFRTTPGDQRQHLQHPVVHLPAQPITLLGRGGNPHRPGNPIVIPAGRHRGQTDPDPHRQ